MIPAECTNVFVRVEYESSQSRIICQFLNESDVSLKSCSVQYGNCDGSEMSTVLSYFSQGNSTAEAPNKIELDVNPKNLVCYAVTASSDSLSILVEGRITSAGNFFSAYYITFLCCCE